MYKICRTEKSLNRQRQLEDGLLEYMDVVPFFKMEITDLCRHLNIPRKTFYRYFGSKEDALYALIDHRIGDMNNYVRECKQKFGQDRTASFFTFWKEQHRFLDILNRNYLGGVLMMRAVHQNNIPMEYGGYEGVGGETEEDYLTIFLISGMMTMMVQWYQSGFKKSIAELSEISEYLFRTPINDIFHL